ncbi:MAG: MFS transporter [Bacteroidales bacterium]|nr:MFS transporter [Bacteroides sp.]MCM1197437.1 MFS transporter [Clostridium sp.]MCM1501197.1 MFS transporter [Bacteroidales bacterium]
MANLLRDNKGTRWLMLLFISVMMFAAYVASDNIFAVETTLTGADYGITEGEYSSLAGAYSIFNVYLLMLIFGGLILDKMGIRFTGIMSCLLMVAGIGMLTWSLFDLRAMVTSGAELPVVNFLGSGMRTPVLWAVIGIGIYGVGAEIAGITATKAIAKWFVGYEMALAMGLQLALARLGTGIAYGATPPIVSAAGGNVGVAVLIGLVLLAAGLMVFLVYCIYDKKLDSQTAALGLEEGGASPEDEFHFKDIMEVVKNPAFWMIAFLCLLFYAAVNPFLKYSTGMMVSKFGVSQELAGLFPLILPFGCIVLTPLFGGIYDRKGHGADLMIFGAVLITAVHLIFAIPSMTNKIVAIILMVLLGVGFAMLPSAMWPSIAKIMPAKLLGTTMALTFYIQNIGFIFVPKAIGAIKSATGNNYTYVMFFFAGLGVVALVLAIGVKLLDSRKGYGLQEPNIK